MRFNNFSIDWFENIMQAIVFLDDLNHASHLTSVPKVYAIYRSPPPCQICGQEEAHEQRLRNTV
jgi:hypothetical protein